MGELNFGNANKVLCKYSETEVGNGFPLGFFAPWKQNQDPYPYERGWIVEKRGETSNMRPLLTATNRSSMANDTERALTLIRGSAAQPFGALFPTIVGVLHPHTQTPR